MPRRVSRRELRKRRQREKMLANIMITVVMAIAVIWVFAYYINDYRNAITGNNTPETTGEYTEVAKKPQDAHKPDASNEDDNQESESADTDSLYELDIDRYKEDLDNALEHNPEVKDYVESFSKKLGSYNDVLTREELEAQYPLLIQWDDRWGYAEYGGSVVGLAGCGPTCLSMVAVALTHNEKCTPLNAAKYSMDNGYCLDSSGTIWDLFAKGAEGYGLKSKEIPLDEAVMKNVLDQGKMIVCSMGPGDFTTQGHYLVVYGYDSDGFMINDPNSRTRSAMRWEYNRLHDQIRNLWSFEALNAE